MIYTNVVRKKNNITDIIATGKNVMTKLTTLLRANKLTLNADKSSFTIFKSNKKVIHNIPDKIEFLGQNIKRSTHNKFLGITLDENLTFNNHITELSNKLKKLLILLISHF